MAEGGAVPTGGEHAEQVWRALREGFEAAEAAAAGSAAGETRCVELCPICRTADILRAGGSPELRGQLSDLQREALLTMRSLLDHYIARLDRAGETGPAVEEIPID